MTTIMMMTPMQSISADDDGDDVQGVDRTAPTNIITQEDTEPSFMGGADDDADADYSDDADADADDDMT